MSLCASFACFVDGAKPASGAECSTTLAGGWRPFCAPRLRLRIGHSACDHVFVVAERLTNGCYRICYRTRWHVPG